MNIEDAVQLADRTDLTYDVTDELLRHASEDSDVRVTLLMNPLAPDGITADIIGVTESEEELMSAIEDILSHRNIVDWDTADSVLDLAEESYAAGKHDNKVTNFLVTLAGKRDLDKDQQERLGEIATKYGNSGALLSLAQNPTTSLDVARAMLATSDAQLARAIADNLGNRGELERSDLSALIERNEPSLSRIAAAASGKQPHAHLPGIPARPAHAPRATRPSVVAGESKTGQSTIEDF
jgi:hypothetical protein